GLAASSERTARLDESASEIAKTWSESKSLRRGPPAGREKPAPRIKAVWPGILIRTFYRDKNLRRGAPQLPLGFVQQDSVIVFRKRPPSSRIDIRPRFPWTVGCPIVNCLNREFESI